MAEVLRANPTQVQLAIQLIESAKDLCKARTENILMGLGGGVIWRIPPLQTSGMCHFPTTHVPNVGWVWAEEHERKAAANASEHASKSEANAKEYERKSVANAREHERKSEANAREHERKANADVIPIHARIEERRLELASLDARRRLAEDAAPALKRPRFTTVPHTAVEAKAFPTLSHDVLAKMGSDASMSVVFRKVHDWVCGFNQRNRKRSLSVTILHLPVNDAPNAEQVPVVMYNTPAGIGLARVDWCVHQVRNATIQSSSSSEGSPGEETDDQAARPVINTDPGHVGGTEPSNCRADVRGFCARFAGAARVDQPPEHRVLGLAQQEDDIRWVCQQLGVDRARFPTNPSVSAPGVRITSDITVRWRSAPDRMTPSDMARRLQLRFNHLGAFNMACWMRLLCDYDVDGSGVYLKRAAWFMRRLLVATRDIGNGPLMQGLSITYPSFWRWESSTRR